jgi:integrase
MDIFIFGCSVALRVSDLLQLSRKNLILKDGKHYLQVKSKKTATLTSIKLPQYCIEIIHKYQNKNNLLLPEMTAQYFNRKLKDLAIYFPDNYEYVKVRERRGKQVVVYKDPIKKLHFKLSDHISSHTMRRTAISVMLNLGMPEHIVRKISGHAPNSKEFYRYVQLAQNTIDFESDRIFNKIGSKSKK